MPILIRFVPSAQMRYRKVVLFMLCDLHFGGKTQTHFCLRLKGALAASW
jgi:hypothetical protein